MKKKFLLGLGLILIISLTACGKKETSELENNPDVIIDEETGIILVDPESELVSGNSADVVVNPDGSKECGSQPDIIEIPAAENGNIFGKWINKDNKIIFEAKKDKDNGSIGGDSIMLLSENQNLLYIGQMQADNFFSLERKDYNYYFEQGNLHISIDDIDYVFEPATETEFNSLYDLFATNETKTQIEEAEKVEELDVTVLEGCWVAEDNSLALFIDEDAIEYITSAGYSHEHYLQNASQFPITIHDNYIEDNKKHAFYYEFRDGGLYVTPIIITCEYNQSESTVTTDEAGNEIITEGAKTLASVKTEEQPTIFMNKISIDDYYRIADSIIQQ